MERLYGKKSYYPSTFEIDFWGSKGGDDWEYQDFRKRKIKGNILLAAYYCPVTIQEISVELGVSLPYLEDEINLLLDRQYLVCKNGKYLTNIPIFTLDCTSVIAEKLKKLTESAAERFIAVTDKFSECFGEKFDNENLLRWQKVLMCLHFALKTSDGNLKKYYGQFPEEGPYSLVNGGGGRGIIWGRSKETVEENKIPEGLQGIYNGCPAQDGRGSVIAINFVQTLNAQHFVADMTNPVVCTAFDSFDDLSAEWKKLSEALGYSNSGKANFPIYSNDEYEALSYILSECIDIVSELHQKTSEIASTVTAELAPAHIRKTAEYVGAFIYRFNSMENLVKALFDMKWLNPVDDKEKPAICVVKN